MTIATDIKAKTAAVRLLLNDIDALADQITAPPSPTTPTPLDCLTGWTSPVPTMNPGGGGEQDMGIYNGRLATFDADNNGLPNGTVLFIGNSQVFRLTQAQLLAASPSGYNMGINGDTYRGVLNRINRNNIIHRAGAVVFFAPHLNDLWESASGYVATEAENRANINFMLDLLAPCIRGKWLVIPAYPVRDPANSFPQYNNTNISSCNLYLKNKLSQPPFSQYVTMLDLWDQLADGTGQLATQYNLDNQHLNDAGNSLVAAAVRAKLHDMGIVGH